MRGRLTHHRRCPHRPRRGSGGRRLLAGVLAAAAVSSLHPGTLLPHPSAKKPRAPAVAAAPARWSAAATADVPVRARAVYDRAARACPKLTPYLLAGIGKVESDHGRSPAPGVRAGVNRFGCCAGPMQFSVIPSAPTWQRWARPGDSVYDLTDAVSAAARKLCHDGLKARPGNLLYQGRPDPCPTVGGSNASNRALRRYNNECTPYAANVIAWARRYAPAGTRRVA